MTSLSETYTGGGADASVRRRYLGGGLFVAGVSFAVLGTLLGTTDLLSGLGYGLYEARRAAGVLAGVGVPALFLGVLTLVPVERRVRFVATVGAALATLAVLWFWTVYPAHWAGHGLDRTLPVAALYLVGLTLTIGCLFVGVAGFKTRNAPGGTVSLSVFRKGEIRVVEVDPRGQGSVGVLGGVELDRPARGDGGTATKTESATTQPMDAYCGNCRYVEYATQNGQLKPYCSYHDSEMESMDACESWTPRKQS